MTAYFIYTVYIFFELTVGNTLKNPRTCEPWQEGGGIIYTHICFNINIYRLGKTASSKKKKVKFV